jgi:hypothetical protein
MDGLAWGEHLGEHAPAHPVTATLLLLIFVPLSMRRFARAGLRSAAFVPPAGRSATARRARRRPPSPRREPSCCASESTALGHAPPEKEVPIELRLRTNLAVHLP